MISPSRTTVRPWSPTPEQAVFLQSVEPTRNLLHKLPDSVLRQYAGQWIAARDSEIIAAAPTRAELCAILGDRDNSCVLKLRIEKGVTIRWQNLYKAVDAPPFPWRAGQPSDSCG